MRVGLIGFGSIGRRVAELLSEGAVPGAEICGILVRNPDRHDLGALATSSLAEFIARSPDVVVEVAGHVALVDYGEKLLRRRITLLSISAGALTDAAFRDRLFAAAQLGGGRLILPSGAIGGLDAIESARAMGLESVRHVVRKPPRSLFDDPARADEVAAGGVPVTLYEGPADEATRRFPANVNVVALVSLAGLGFARTTAVVVADPGVEHNTHEVVAEGAFGRIEIKVQNVPSPDNPKTGLIVAGSVVRALARLSSPVNIGG